MLSFPIRRKDSRRPTVRLTLEPLEERLVLSIQPVTDTTPYPFSAVVQIDVSNHGKGLSGTGALIDSTHVLTAAHVLYDIDTRTLAGSVTVYAGRNGVNVVPFGGVRGTRVVVHALYASGRYAGTAAYDLGIITLDRPLGNTTGFFGVSSLFQDSYFDNGGTLDILGYPGDTHSGVNQFFDTGPALDADANDVYWRMSDLPIEHGSSGSPVYVKDSSGHRSITAVVSELSTTEGIGTRITAAKYNWIQTQLSAATTSTVAPPATQTPATPTSTHTPGAFDPGTGTWYLRNSSSAGAPDFTPFAYGGAGWQAVTGDWNGDGFDTVGVVDPSTATWYLRNTNSSGAPDIAAFAYGVKGWIPVVGDWDGDGVDTVGMFDPKTATWYLHNSNAAGAPDFTPFQFGAPGWIPVVGDWDGDGTTTIGVVDPTTETWYLRNSNAPGGVDVAPFRYGAPGWVPLESDWNGDGTATVGVVDPGTGTWYLRNSNSAGGADYAPFAYGSPGWTPVGGDWNGFGGAQRISGPTHPVAKALGAVITAGQGPASGADLVVQSSVTPETEAQAADRLGGSILGRPGGNAGATQEATVASSDQGGRVREDLTDALFARWEALEQFLSDAGLKA